MDFGRHLKTAHKNEVFFSKCDQIRSFLENVIFCSVAVF